jgi:hypothetical protein
MLRFTIRELVLVTVIVALGVAWWLDRRRTSHIVSQLEARAVESSDREAKLEGTIKKFEDYARHLYGQLHGLNGVPERVTHENLRRANYEQVQKQRFDHMTRQLRK